MVDKLKLSEAGSFSEVLELVMSDSDYLSGIEPDGSGWDMGNWPGFDFREFQGWVEREKFFEIAAIDGRHLPLRIIQTDPRQFEITTPDTQPVNVKFTISPVSAKEFPTIMIGKSIIGQEIILRNQREPLSWHQIPSYFQDLAKSLGVNNVNKVVSDTEGKTWANFLCSVLKSRQFFPTHFVLTDAMVRDRLELEEDESFSDRDRLYAEMDITQEELIMLAYSDFIIS